MHEYSINKMHKKNEPCGSALVLPSPFQRAGVTRLRGLVHTCIPRNRTPRGFGSLAARSYIALVGFGSSPLPRFPHKVSGWPPLLSHLRTVAPSFTSRLRVLSGLTSLTWASVSPWPCPLKCLYISTDFRESQALFSIFFEIFFGSPEHPHGALGGVALTISGEEVVSGVVTMAENGDQPEAGNLVATPRHGGFEAIAIGHDRYLQG